jgi:hypothetical protein
MIREITIKGVATYPEDEQKLENLGKINFVFGSNGSGKTTLSRILASPERYPSCSVKWENDDALCTRVYNADFIDENFKSDDSIPGIFMLGSDENKTRQEINEIYRRIEVLRTEQLGYQDTIKMIERELYKIRKECAEQVWKEGEIYFEGAFKELFSGHLRSEIDLMKAVRFHKSDKSYDEESLKESKQLVECRLSGKCVVFDLQIIDEYKLILGGLYDMKNEILNKKVIGDKGLDISRLIEKLGNIDWVNRGRGFLCKSGGICPFCQQTLTDDFERQLVEYFSDEYKEYVNRLSKVCNEYRRKGERLIELGNQIIELEEMGISISKLQKFVLQVEATLNKNIIELKKKEETPSKNVVLEWNEELVSGCIDELDKVKDIVRRHNEMAETNFDERRNLAEIAYSILAIRTKDCIRKYEGERVKLEKKKDKERDEVRKNNEEIKDCKSRLQELNSNTKMLRLRRTRDYINGVLDGFGFTGFRIEVNEEKKEYYLVGDNRDQIQKTLSEGEKSFITFLYFLALLKGSKENSGAVTPQVVVIDDPVSSLDNEILFIVSLLIRKLYNETIKENGAIKQVLVLSHNLYFYKEVTFKQSCDRKIARELNHHWVVRKRNGRSKIEFSEENPIKSTYEILWSDVREAINSPKNVNPNSLQNTMRRILEHYYKYYGDVSLNRLPENVGIENRDIVKELLLWVNDGSHASFDDICYAPLEERSVERYLSAFRLIFDKMGHLQHYKMMMKIESGDEI